MMYLHSPAGNRAPATVASRGEPGGLSTIAGWEARWFGSGTMALAAAVGLARADSPGRVPKVALAAYGCPDLVAAIRFAGAQPVYVDLARDRLSMDVDELRAALAANPSIVAVIGVDLFGIPERWPELRAAGASARVSLIQDCAQSVQPRDRIAQDLRGDFVVYSFGRGKPVCLLGGGALLVPAGRWRELAASGGTPVDAGEFAPRFLPLRLAAYDLLIRPRCYSAVASLAGKRLGETKFVPLGEVKRASGRFAASADAAMESFWKSHTDRTTALSEVLEPLFDRFGDDLHALVPRVASGHGSRLLSRYPLLIRDPTVRDRWIGLLRRSGISATRMYKRTLPEIVADDGRRGKGRRYENARRIANELVTLPVHDRLTLEEVGVMARTLEACLSKN